MVNFLAYITIRSSTPSQELGMNLYIIGERTVFIIDNQLP